MKKSKNKSVYESLNLESFTLEDENGKKTEVIIHLPFKKSKKIKKSNLKTKG